MRAVQEARARGSILQGEVEVPRHVSFTYEPASMQAAGYRDAARLVERTLEVVYRKPGFAWFSAQETTIHIDASQLTVEDKRGQQRFAVGAIEQLYVGPSPRSGKWALMLRAAGRDHVLIDEMQDAADGEPVEQLVEEFLSLKDRAGLSANVRNRLPATRVLSDSSKLHVEVVEAGEGDEGFAQLRAQTKGPSWSMAFLFGFLMVHNTFLLGGLLSAFLHPGLGLLGGLSIGAFWATFLIRELVNRFHLFADDHTLVVQRGRVLTRKIEPLSLQDIRQIDVRRSAIKVNGRYRHTVVARTIQGELRLSPALPREQAQALGRALRRHLKEARRSLADKERARVRVADDADALLEEEAREQAKRKPL